MLFPLLHNGDGAFAWPATEIEEIAATIRVILTVIPGQHQRLPDFGNHAALLLFRNPGPGLEERISALIKFDIETWEPRAQVDSVVSVYDDTTASYYVEITWSPKISPANTQQRMSISLSPEGVS
ncbi:MAG: GPW/gp25 family protein [Bacteroidota bacterium]